MISRDYTKEVGVDSGAKTIPWPLAWLVLSLIAIGLWYTVGEARAAAHKEEQQKQAVAAEVAAQKAPGKK
ncbi:MAG: hypothetical protein HZA93_23325 [Verrucomicrobia bacterium]|nr:hypothetical protein [Verrucomicrobiota bacterium]